MEKKELADIELRSEKARTFIGQVPPCIVRNGTIVITIILIVIAISFYKIPYPISIEIKGKVVNKETIEAYVPYRYVGYFQTPKMANVTFEGYRNMSYLYNITIYNKKLIHRNDGNYFKVKGIVKNNDKDFPAQVHMNASLRIIISDKTLYQQFFAGFVDSDKQE